MKLINSASSCGDGTCGEDEDCSSCAADCGACPEYTVAFDLDGLMTAVFVHVTGTFDNWSGWGVNTDTGITQLCLTETMNLNSMC